MGGREQMVNAQNNVFYFESDIAKVFPFRPTCSSYDSERKKGQKVNQKGPEKKVNKCGKFGLAALGGLYGDFLWYLFGITIIKHK